MVDCEDSGNAETWDDWVAEGNDVTFCCLFCSVEVKDEEALHTHLEQHQFSLLHQISGRKLDTYATIQFVNFLRTMHKRGLAVDEIMKRLDNEGDAAFRRDEFLQPVIHDDPLLYCLATADDDDSDDEEWEEKNDTIYTKSINEQLPYVAPTATDVLERLEVENRQLKQQLLNVSALMRDFVIDDEKVSIGNTVKPADNDTYYFDSYSHVGIHREMITDRVRTDGYRNAILNNPELFKGKVVLDVGCGTGILSMFAAQAGAERVIGIDFSEMGTVASEIVRDNGFSGIITIVRGKVEEIELPVDNVDVIISEWMGYCLLYEAMLDTVLFARDKWLVPGGHLFPDKCSLHIQGIYDSKERFGFWDQVYGFNMQAIKSKISVRDGFVEDVDPQDVLTDRALLKRIDIDNVTYDELDFHSNFVLTVTKAGTMHGFVSSFDIGFERDCIKPEYFTTGVEGIPTHWHQVFFHVETPFTVKTGETIEGKWWIRRNADNPRYLDVELQWKRENVESFTLQSFRVHE